MEIPSIARQIATLNAVPTTLNSTDHSGKTNLFSPHYTKSYGNYSCLASFYYLHVIFCYLTFLSGLACLITRALPPKYKKIHAWSGRIYILAMLWATSTSLLIHNTGLPPPTIVSFGAALIGMSIGWIAISVYRRNLQAEAFAQINAKFLDDFGSLQECFSTKIQEILSNKTFVQRYISLKSLHGVLFFISWFNIMGRIFAAPLSNDYACYTLPAYKPIDTPLFKGLNKPLTLVPEKDPFPQGLPWVRVGGNAVWAVLVTGGSGAFMAAVLAIAAYGGARNSAKSRDAAAEEDFCENSSKDSAP